MPRTIPVPILAVLTLSGCTHRPPPLPPLETQMRRAVFEIATGAERRAFDEAALSGRDSLDAFMERFWAACDPIPDTESNEYRERFIGRLTRGAADLLPESGGGADDRLSAFILYGPPTQWTGSSRVISGLRGGVRPSGSIWMQTLWVYDLPEETWYERPEHPALKGYGFSILFEQDGAGGHHRVDEPGLGYAALAPMKPTHVEGLAAILADSSRGATERAVAAWRLGIDPSPAALGALIRAVDDPDPEVYRMVLRGLQPLVPVTFANTGETRLVVGSGEITSRMMEFATVRQRSSRAGPSSGDPAASEEGSGFVGFLDQVYDPSVGLPDLEVAELRRIGAEAVDLTSQDRGWLTVEESAAIYVGSLGIARDLIDRGESVAAHELLEPLLRSSQAGSAEAWHLDALALAESGSPGGRQMAEERVRRALRLDPGNVRYRLTLADILSRRTLDYYADRNLDWVIDEHPAAASAYAMKARLRLQILWEIGWRAGGWGMALPGSDDDPRALQEYALALLGRALLLHPENRFAGWWLGSHYLMTNQWQDVVPVMTYLIRHEVHLAEGYLGRGLALQNLGKHELAMRDYLDGRAGLPAHVKPLMDNPAWVMAPSEGGFSVTGTRAVPPPIVAEESTRFWQAKDPLFSSEVNERLMEQYRRFAHVTWHFANPQLGLKGWETQRGRIYLRYGAPQRMVRSGQRRSMEGRREVWEYGDFSVSFRIGMVTGELRVSDPSRMEVLVEETPELPDVVGARPVMDLQTTWYRFKEADGRTVVVPATRLLPAHMSALFPGNRSNSLADLPVELMVLDRNWKVRQKVSARIPGMTFPGLPTARTWVGPPIEIAEDPEDPASFAALEIAPEGYGTALAARDSLQPDPEGVLTLSSLVLGIDEDDGPRLPESPRDDVLERGTVRIVPRPDGSFGRDEAVFLFFEIYGLTRDEIGATSYRIAVTTTSEIGETRRHPLVKALGRLIGRQEKEGSITLTFDRTGIRETEQVPTRIAFPADSPTRRYLITIEVQDLVGEHVARSTIPIVVY